MNGWVELKPAPNGGRVRLLKDRGRVRMWMAPVAKGPKWRRMFCRLRQHHTMPVRSRVCKVCRTRF